MVFGFREISFDIGLGWLFTRTHGCVCTAPLRPPPRPLSLSPSLCLSVPLSLPLSCLAWPPADAVLGVAMTSCGRDAVPTKLHLRTRKAVGDSAHVLSARPFLLCHNIYGTGPCTSSSSAFTSALIVSHLLHVISCPSHGPHLFDIVLDD